MAVYLFLRFPDEDDLVEEENIHQHDVDRIMQTLASVGRDVRENSESVTLFYDNRNIEIFLETIETLYEPEYLITPRNVLLQTLNGTGESWRDCRLHIPDCNYVVWNFESFAITQVVDTTLAEMTERILTYPGHQYLLLNFNQNSLNRKCLPVFKDTVYEENFPRFAHIHVVTDLDEWQLWWNFYREKSGQTQFSLLDRSRFRRTSLVQQGKPVYQEMKTGHFWYLDNFHKTMVR